MDKQTLTLEPRTITGKNVKKLRREGIIPASICGKGVQSESFQLSEREFGFVYRRVGRSGLIDLNLPGGTQSAFVRQVQRHPVSQRVLHVDFRIVDLRVEMAADVPVTVVGESPLAARGDGVVSVVLPAIHVRGLPDNLPQSIEVDLSKITRYDDDLRVRDLKFGDDVQVLTPEDEVVVSITRSRMAVEEEAITEQEQLGEPELNADNADTAGSEAADDE